MAIEIKVPAFPESVVEGTIAKWYKKPGEFIKQDEPLLDVETDKVVLEVVAPQNGALESILKHEGEQVVGEQIVAFFLPGKQETTERLSPAVRRAIAEKEVALSEIQGTGVGGRITKQDVMKSVEKPKERSEKRVMMSRIRARIAERLVAAQHTAAILTTFNEINMQPVLLLRAKYKALFEEKHGVKLGLMSFFTMAVLEALQRFPVVNAFIEEDSIVYHDYYDIGIAVSSPRGLVVPVIRNAENNSMAEIEKQITYFSERAQRGQLTIEEISGGTFTISNGGIFGSLLSTPILNPPQSAILGMHKITERPVVVEGQIVIRPMMYVALSYDHRIIDGSESVRFLLTIKEILEDPVRICLGV
jgi:2-oxoglutarate dehydrogenase E2 component (dihydrolipoamide succinyltransferase)